MPDNEFLIKITGDASQAKEAINAAKEQLDKAGKSVEMLADLIGVKVPDALKKMIASSELVGPALAEAFGPLSLIIFGIEILQRVAEKMEQMDEEAEKHRRAWQDIGIASDDATRKIEDSIEKQEQKYIEITQGPIAGMEFALGHMRSVALSAFADIAGAMDRVATELTEESSWFNVNKEAAADIKATIGDMHKAMDDAVKAAPKDPFAPIIAQESVLSTKIKETNKEIDRRSANMGADKSLVDPLKQEVALYEDILSKLRLQKDLQAEALKTANAEINKAKTDRSVTLDVAKIEADKRTNDAIIQQEQETIRELAAAHQISAEDELSLNKTILDQKFAQDETALNKKLEQLNRDRNRNAAEIITVQGEIKALTTQHYTELEKLNADYYKHVEHNGQEAVNKAAAKMHAFLQQVKESQQIILESAKAHDQAMGQIADQRLNFELQIGKISQADYEKQLQWEMAETYANERAKLEAKRQAAEGNLVEQAKVDAELQKLDDKYRAASEKAEQQSLLRRRQQFDQYFKQVSSSFNTALNGWMQGTETASQAFGKMFQDILSQLINFVEQWIEKKIEMWLMDKFISEGTQSAAATAQIESNAAVAYSGAYAATAAIPFVGPELAPEAAWMAYMDVMAMTPAGFALGGIVPATGLALVHQGERVLPASMSGTGDFGSPSVHVHFNVSAIDSDSFKATIKRHGNMIGSEVARVEASLTDTVNGVPILQAIGQGLFDGAAFRIDRLFMDSASHQIGTVVRFSGFIGAVDELTRSSAKLTVNAGTAYLNLQLPAIILQPGCTNTLFDARCGLFKASFANNLVVQAGSTVNKIISGSAQSDTYFDNGQLVFNTGPNTGLVKAIRQYIAGVMSFNSPLPFAPNAGDTFTAYPGCDKTQTTCTGKFNNLTNFEGFPYVPAPETAI